MYALRTVGPLLVQDATRHPDFLDHPANQFGLTRYLGVPIHSPQGEAIGTLCILDNRSEELLGEEDIRFLSLLAMRVSAEVERERSVRRQVAEHQAMAARLAEVNVHLQRTAEEKRRFVAMVIHDLRQPLTALQTLGYLLRRETEAQERDRQAAALENRVRALSHLLDGLLQYSEIEAGHVRLNLQEVELSSFLQECIEGFAQEGEGEIRFRSEIEADLGAVRTDRDRLTHIVLNLLSNALKYTPRGSVWVRARSQGADRWLLEVEDTGIGMSEEVRKRVFDEFYRAPDMDVEKPGIGLGMAIVKQLCDAIRGELTLESVPGAGTRCAIVFPRTLDTSPNTES